MTDYKKIIFSSPARVLSQAVLQERATPAQLLALAKSQQAFDPAAFDEQEPFFFPAEISNNKLDAHFTRMALSSLQNYAADAKAGVSFQNSHACWELGFGRTLTGTLEQNDEDVRVLADFYTVPGINLNGVSTDDLIRGIRFGLVKDVSIGFYGGDFICGLCNMSVWGSPCPHIPGFEYEIKDPNTGETVRTEVAWAWVTDAHLSEVSAVYDGSTPGAAILKAQQEMDAGRLKPETARMLENQYRSFGLNLSSARHVWPGANFRNLEGTMPPGNTPTPPEPTPAPTPTPAPEPQPTPTPPPTPSETRATATVTLRSILDAAGAPKDKSEDEGVRWMADELTRLRPLADDGTRYRKDLIDAAVKEGIRAQGDKFKEESQRALLAKLDLDDIIAMTESWRAIGDVKFPPGRQSSDEPDGEERTAVIPVNELAYSG